MAAHSAAPEGKTNGRTRPRSPARGPDTRLHALATAGAQLAQASSTENVDACLIDAAVRLTAADRALLVHQAGAVRRAANARLLRGESAQRLLTAIGPW